jgi:3-deoxy-7-phosphoheptulonate synthase
MLVVMDVNATDEEIERVSQVIREMGFTPKPMPGGVRTAICILGNKGAVDPGPFLTLPGVKEAIRVSRPYKLVSRETHREDTVVRVGSAEIGGGGLAVIAGPCAVESEEQALTIARRVKAAGAELFRGGAFKPRTSPYSFQGLGEKGLDILVRVREETGLPVVTEAIDHDVCGLVEAKADIIQIGARNMQNYTLLRRAGKAKKPILLKRGMSATIEEWLMAAEYILNEGNRRVILCERGVRTFADHTRNTLDLSAIPVVKSLSHLPVVVDPSHAAGIREFVPALAKAAVSVGADGLMIEVHHDPERALSDGAQSLRPEEFETLMGEIR